MSFRSPNIFRRNSIILDHILSFVSAATSVTLQSSEKVVPILWFSGCQHLRDLASCRVKSQEVLRSAESSSTSIPPWDGILDNSVVRWCSMEFFSHLQASEAGRVISSNLRFLNLWKWKKTRLKGTFFLPNHFAVEYLQNPTFCKIFLLEVLISPKDGSRLAGFDCSGPQRPMLKAQAEAAPGSYTPEDCLGALGQKSFKDDRRSWKQRCGIWRNTFIFECLHI